MTKRLMKVSARGRETDVMTETNPHIVDTVALIVNIIGETATEAAGRTNIATTTTNVRGAITAAVVPNPVATKKNTNGDVAAEKSVVIAARAGVESTAAEGIALVKTEVSATARTVAKTERVLTPDV